MKRTILTIKQIDYTSEKEYLKDLPKMQAQGYKPLTDRSHGFDSMFSFGQVDDNIFTVAYMKDNLYEAYNK